MQYTHPLYPGGFEVTRDPAVTTHKGRPTVNSSTLFLDFASEDGRVTLRDGFGSRLIATREAPSLTAHLRRLWDLQTNDHIPARDLPGLPHTAQPEIKALRREFPDLQPIDGEW